MSVKEMNRVWENSKQSGAALLAMLALADMANNDGQCWPGQAKLAERTRSTRRTIIRIIQSCVDAEELAVKERPGKNHVYLILVGLSPEEQKARLQLFAETVDGDLKCCDKMSHLLQGRPVTPDHTPCDKMSHPPVSEMSHPPVHDHAQTCTRSVNDPSIDPTPDPSVSRQADKPKEKPARKPRPRNPFFDAICEVCNLDPDHLPPDLGGSAVGKVMKNLKAANWQAEDMARYHAWRQAKGLGPLGSIHWLVEEMAKRDWQNGSGSEPSNGSGSHGAMPPAPVDTRARDAVAEIMRQRRGES